LNLIALLKLCAAAALNAINADKGAYSVSNEDYIRDNRHMIYKPIVIDYFTFLLLLPGRFGASIATKNSVLLFPFCSLSSFWNLFRQ
jgi:hypothetical protein